MNTAKSQLLEFQSLGLRRRGPFYLFRTKNEVALFAKMARTANRAVVRVDDRTHEAPDPWHAVLYLQKEVQAWGFLPPSRSPGAPLFRGQRNIDWPIVSSLRRQKSIAEQTHSRQRLDLYCRCLEAFEIEETAAGLKPDSHIATAQHYSGMPTPYLDFTVDPLIAVYFACANACEGERVVVYQMHFNDAHALGARVLVPPPWVRRLRRQKGLFLHAETDDDLGRYCQRLIFPATAAYTAWIDETEPVLPETKWFTDLAARVTTRPHSQLDARLSPADLRTWIVATCGEPPFLYDSLRAGPIAEWCQFIDEMAEWLALRASGPGSSYWDCVALIHLAHDNPGWFRMFRDAMKLLPSLVGEFLPAGQSPNRSMVELWDQLERCLRENDVRRGVWNVKGFVPAPSSGSILNRIEAYAVSPNQAAKPEPYDARVRNQNPVPPTRVDALVSDIWLLVQRLELDAAGPENVEEYQVGAALETYLMRDWTGVPGYRPWTHWNFVRSLSEQERTQLARDITTYLREGRLRES